MEKLNRMFNNKELPIQFQYKVNPNADNVNMEKLRYNAFYRSYEFYEQKFPKGYENLPGFDKVIQLCADNNKDNSPAQELDMLQNISEKEEIRESEISQR